MLYILTPVFCVALCVGAVFSFSDNNRVTASAAEAKSINTTMTVTEQHQYTWSAGVGFTQQSIDYTTLITGSGNHTVDFADKKISVYGTGYGAGEAIYVGFSVSVTIPAWTKYDMDFPFEMQAVKTNQATGTVGRTRTELLSFSNPTDTDPTVYTAANGDGGAPITINKVYANSGSSVGYNGDPTSGANVTSELMLVQNQNTNWAGTTLKPLKDTKTIEETYENRSDNSVTVNYNFGFCANDFSSAASSRIGMGMQSCPSYLLLKGCTAEITDLSYEAPASVSTPYTGTAYTDSNLNTISAITSASWYNTDAMTLSLPNGTAKDAGSYDLEVALKATGATDGPWKLSDGTFSYANQTVKLTINKVDPVISFGNASTTDQYTVSGEKDEFPKCTATYNGSAVAGTLTWVEDGPEGSAEGVRKDYHWTFTPTDTTNFNTKSGTISLNYVTPGIESITATFDSKGVAVYKSTPKATRDGYFTVMVKYAGIAEPKQSKSFETLGWDSGTNVPVTIKIGSSISAPVTIPEIGIDKIVSLSAFINQGSTKVTCKTSKDTLKGMLTVLAQWNYAPSTVTLAAKDYDIDFKSVVGTNTSTLTVKYKNSDNTEVSATAMGNLTVDKADYEIPDSLFEDRTETHTGEPFDPTGWIDTTKLPKGMTVSYSCETDMTAVGEHVVKATFSNPDPDNYNDPADKTAKLTISDKNVYKKDNLSFKVTGATEENGAYTATYDPDTTVGFVLEGKLLDKDGNEVDESVVKVDREYKYQKKVNGEWADATAADLKNAGEYRVTVTLTTDDATYDPLKMVTELTIEKADVDMSGTAFKPTGDNASGLKPAADGGFKGTYKPDGGYELNLDPASLPAEATVKKTIYKKLKNGGSKDNPADWEDVTEIKEVGTYKVVVELEPIDKDNYNEIDPLEVAVTISDAVVEKVSANVEDGAKFDINNTLDDLKAKLSAEIEYNNGTKEEVKVEDLTVTCDTLRDGGKFEVGSQTITIKYTAEDGTEHTTTVTVTVAKAKVALPIYKGTLSYTGLELKPTANDFDGYNADIMSFVESKTVAGLNAGAYKAVFALKDSDRYEWATTTTLKKSVLAAVVFDGEISIDPTFEAAVDWNIAKAKISATKAQGKLPVFASESFTGSLAEVVGLKYYTDETFATEVAADELAYSTKYFVRAELLDKANFELDETATVFAATPFEYLTPEKELTVWDKIVNFLKANWLWIVIAVVALILLITIIALSARSAKRKRIREEQAEQRRLEKEEREREEREERRREEREERMARLSQQQAAPQPQYIPQPQYMPQAMSQPMPQMAQPMSMGGGMVDGAQITRIETELATLKAAQAAKDLAELKAEQAAMRSDISALRSGEQVGGISVDAMTEIMTMALKNVLATATQQAIAAQPAQPAQLTDGTTANAAPATAQVPPDAVMTTVTTTKIDTTKKSAQGNAQATAARPIVRNYVAPMPVDDGRVFDVGGFYKPADPVDIEGDEDNK